jgi:Ca2+-binding EF-hand superfamily protein
VKIRSIVYVAAFCILGTSALANAEENLAVKEIEEGAFASIDTLNRGYVTIGALSRYRNLVFASMDANNDNRVSLQEYLEWGFGGSLIAEEAGKMDAYTAARKVIFFYRDRDGDEQLTEAEFRVSTINDFRRADLNNNGRLEKDEFTKQFAEFGALRFAVK